MKHKKYKIIPLVLVIVAVVGALGFYLHGHTIAVLQPAGQIGDKERNLLIFGVLLSVIVVVPTFALTIFIALRYREGNPKAKKYTPDFDHSRLFESIWWGIPIVIIGILSVVTWQSSHALDPYKALASHKKPLTVQVVALDWKWLFIYPKQNVASVNLLQLPVGTPVDFEITSDTVMNSFWVPSLGGQIYAMPGMVTQLHLVADKAGSYNGSSANISGQGFAGMTFTARAASQSAFTKWVQSARQAPKQLTMRAYSVLARPSQNNPPVHFSSVQNSLFDDVVLKYMTPGPPDAAMQGMAM